MNINTSIVKSKEYNSPIRPNAQKCSQEYRVLAILRYLYPERFDGMTKAESPDFQDCEKDIGIEVTVAVQECDMKASRTFNELREGKQNSPEKCKIIIEQCGYSMFMPKDGIIGISSCGTADGEKRFFQESIRRKLKKLKKYRTRLDNIGLAILLPEIPTQYAEEHFQLWIQEIYADSTEWFDFFFIISNRFCIYYDVQANYTEKKYITQDESRLLSTIGRMTAEGELSLDDEAWL